MEMDSSESEATDSMPDSFFNTTKIVTLLVLEV